MFLMFKTTERTLENNNNSSSSNNLIWNIQVLIVFILHTHTHTHTCRCALYRAFPSYLTGKRQPNALASLLNFLKVIVTAIVRLAPVSDCYTSPTRGIRHNAGRCVSVKQEKNKHPVLVVNALF
jgi:hypothetical protein